ncbi:hypothetical protein EVAR_24445_1 [Eumeta japonica]|uniref:Uncharacterized protein n=1 Tax=Eumeta variegata TaxID=151549 RepID=A0A4C1WYS5_EUMVA|nr:hypothetical protein EVAR_24445_1 [Eumeta japonica]
MEDNAARSFSSKQLIQSPKVSVMFLERRNQTTLPVTSNDNYNPFALIREPVHRTRPTRYDRGSREQGSDGMSCRLVECAGGRFPTVFRYITRREPTTACQTVRRDIVPGASHVDATESSEPQGTLGSAVRILTNIPRLVLKLVNIFEGCVERRRKKMVKFQGRHRPPGVEFENSYLQMLPIDKAKCPYIKSDNDVQSAGSRRALPGADDKLASSHIDFADPTVIYFHAFMESAESGSALAVREGNADFSC